MAAWVIPAIALAVTVGSTALAYQQQREAASAQKKSNSIERQGQDADVRRQRVLEIARARRERAAAVNFAEGSGVNAAGSSVAGGINSVTSQSAGNQAFLTSRRDFARKAGRQLDNASQANTRAQGYDLVGSFGQLGLDNSTALNSFFKMG
jgi:hypothetical protein